MDTLKPKNSKSIKFTVRGGFFTFWAILAHGMPWYMCTFTTAKRILERGGIQTSSLFVKIDWSVFLNLKPISRFFCIFRFSFGQRSDENTKILCNHVFLLFLLSTQLQGKMVKTKFKKYKKQ